MTKKLTTKNVTKKSQKIQLEMASEGAHRIKLKKPTYLKIDRELQKKANKHLKELGWYPNSIINALNSVILTPDDISNESYSIYLNNAKTKHEQVDHIPYSYILNFWKKIKENLHLERKEQEGNFIYDKKLKIYLNKNKYKDYIHFSYVPLIKEEIDNIQIVTEDQFLPKDIYGIELQKTCGIRFAERFSTLEKLNKRKAELFKWLGIEEK